LLCIGPTLYTRRLSYPDGHCSIVIGPTPGVPQVSPIVWSEKVYLLVCLLYPLPPPPPHLLRPTSSPYLLPPTPPPSFFSTFTALPADAQQAKMHEILCTMPPPNVKTLRYLLTHLHNVQEYQEVNKMSASNLAIVFWPTLMRPPLLDLTDPSKQLGWQLAMTLIIEHPDFVPQVDLV